MSFTQRDLERRARQLHQEQFSMHAADEVTVVANEVFDSRRKGIDAVQRMLQARIEELENPDPDSLNTDPAMLRAYISVRGALETLLHADLAQ